MDSILWTILALLWTITIILTVLWRIWMLCTISILLTFSYCCFRKDVSNHYLQKKVLLINFSKISIFSHFLLIEGYGKDVMCNELVIATFIERFKIATLTKPYWYISLPFKAIRLTISFFLTFCWKKTINRVLYQSIQTLVLSQSNLKKVLWESLTDSFY